MTDEPERTNQRVFALLARFIPLLDDNASTERLQSVFPQFRDFLKQLTINDDIYEEFYSPKCRLLFGRIVHCLLSIFEQKRNDKSIRSESAHLLGLLFDPTNSKCSEAASIAFVLPGVVTKCVIVVRSEPTTQFIESALDKIVCSALGNCLVHKLNSDPDSESDTPLALRRDSQFFKTTAEKVSESVKMLIKHVAATQSERDRLKLLELVEEIWRNCGSTFCGTSFVQLRLQLAVRFSFDDWKSIRSKARNAIHDLVVEFPDVCFDQAKTTIVSSITSILQRKANSLDSLQMLSQFMSILDKDQMHAVFKPDRKNKSLFKRLRSALELSIDVELRGAVVCDLNSEDQDIFTSIPLKDTIKPEYLERILNSLVKNGLGKKLFRSIGNLLRSTTGSKRIHSALIMAHLCKTLSKETYKISSNFVIVVQNHLKFVWLKHLERFIEQEPDPSNANPIEASSLWHTKESALCCALLASVAHSMQLMDPKRRDVQRLLVDVLYTVLQFLPSTNMSCASAAHVALEIISKVCNQSVDEFLSENADKVVFKAAMQAKNLRKYPRSPFALAALLDRGYGRGMIDQLSNLIPEILVGISTEDSARIVPCLKAMRSFVCALTGWFPDLLQPHPSDNNDVLDAEFSLSSDSDDGDCIDDDGDNVDDETQSHWDRLERLRDKFERIRQKDHEKPERKRCFDDKKQKPPGLIMCVYRILERIQHLHHSPFLYTRLLLADLLRDALRFVRHFDDQLLPMIHQNWVPMSVSMRRTLRQTNRKAQGQTLNAPDKLIVAAELQTVSCMCEVAGSFLYPKITNELDEPLSEFMHNSVQLSQRTADVYSHSATFKLQAAVLECWPIYCQLAEVSTDRAFKTMQLYADDPYQNPKLREMASEGTEKLSSIPPTRE